MVLNWRDCRVDHIWTGFWTCRGNEARKVRKKGSVPFFPRKAIAFLFALNALSFLCVGSSYGKQLNDYRKYSYLTAESVKNLLEKSAAENRYLSSLGHKFAVSIFNDGGAIDDPIEPNHLLKVNLIPYFRVIASSMVDKKPEELDYNLPNLIVWYSKSNSGSKFPTTLSTTLDEFINAQFAMAKGRSCYFSSELDEQDRTKMMNAFLFVNESMLVEENSLSIADCFHAGISRSFGVAPNFDANSGHYGTDYIAELFLASVIQTCSLTGTSVDERRKCISAAINQSLK